jgi:methionyl-tRNA synthetase
LIVNRINADLANDFGNLAQRSLSMINKNCEAKVPEPGEFTPDDEALLASVDALLDKSRAAIADFAIHQVLNEIWAVVADANRYFAAQAPWVLRKTDEKRMATVLYVTAELLRQTAILAQPVIPDAANRLLDLLAIEPGARDFAHLGPGHRLTPGSNLPAPTGIFPRYVEPAAEAAS